MPRGPAPDGNDKPIPADTNGGDRQSRVGDILRKAYDDAVAEPVPDIFTDLLRKLG